MGREIRKDKAGAISAECAQVLEQLECSAETWVDFVKNFRRRFRRLQLVWQNLVRRFALPAASLDRQRRQHSDLTMSQRKVNRVFGLR